MLTRQMVERIDGVMIEVEVDIPTPEEIEARNRKREEMIREYERVKEEWRLKEEAWVRFPDEPRPKGGWEYYDWWQRNVAAQPGDEVCSKCQAGRIQDNWLSSPFAEPVCALDPEGRMCHVPYPG